MSKRVRILLGCILLTLMSAYYGVYVYSITLPKKGSSDGWSGFWDGKGEPRITSVESNGPATELQVGDEFIAINGVKIRDDPRILNYYNNVPPGTRYTLTIRRAGELRDVTIQTVPHQGHVQFDRLYYVHLLLLLTAWIIFLLRPDDKQAWLLALMLGTLTLILGDDPANLPSWLDLIVSVMSALGLLFLPIFVHFFLIFPDASPLLRRWTHLETRLYLPCLLLLLPIAAAFRAPGDLGLWMLRFQWFRYFPIVASVLISAYLAAGLICLLINYRAASPIARRRLRVVMAGSAAGFFNLFLIVIGGATGLSQRLPTLWSWFDKTLYIALPLVPISFVYAIVRHKVIPVSLIIRRSVRYLLVARGSILLELIVVIVAVTAVLTYIFSRSRPSGIVIGLVSAGVGIAAWKVSEILHDKYLAPLIDRRFFRQSYDAHQIIAELTQSLRTVTGLPQLLELVATKIRSALQTEHVTIFLRDPATGSFNSAYSSDHSQSERAADIQPHGGHLVRYAQMVEQLDQLGKFLDKATNTADVQLESDNGKPVEIGPDELLKGHDSAALLMPLLSKDEMLGIISLGPRLGDLPFSREDKQLLMSVSGPTTLAIENARLVEQMVAEARRLQEMEVDHRRKTEELAFARQLQLSMLPTRNVMLDNIEIIGRMRTASEVGGDYYDFIEMADGRICIAVGDATGHGMAAGLVVGMVKMGLINGLQKLNGGTSVKPIVEDLNRALKRSLSQRGMGMCLSAAILDTSTLKAELFSNGMPAPYHYRSADRNLSQVATQAPPLGFLRQVNVRPVQIELQSGDALLWLSDGFEERLDRMNQVWGSELVAQTLELICAEESAADAIARRMIEACDRAAGGLSNNDDMTIVVAQVKSR
jgi:sigma-B regulation protein RsbU (phosphoserine phosphatase)